MSMGAVGTMDDPRRQRLTNVLQPLTRCERFTRDEAAELVADADPGFVTRTLNEMVRDQMLEQYQLASGESYRWTVREPDKEVQLWIDRQICGDQVKQMPVNERPRERLLNEGVAALSNAELLAILIRVGVRNESATTGGRKVANRFADDLMALRTSSHEDLRQISPAVTKPSYCQIMAGIELGRRVAAEEANREPEIDRITSTTEAIAFCSRRFAHLAGDAVQEEFHIVTLDTKHQPLRTHRITVGTLDASLVHPREVFRPAIRDAAAAVLLVHNHPSGDPTPSREDHAVTERLTEAGKLIGITVLDHIVVARRASVSLRESG
ncbi:MULTISPECIES: RadC family protein [Crateriforma]|nr:MULTISPECIES: DNA repair protein RadC [Crateriforma]